MDDSYVWVGMWNMDQFDAVRILNVSYVLFFTQIDESLIKEITKF